MKMYKDININKMDIKAHNIVFSHTSNRGYEMTRLILLENIDGLKDYTEYLLLEGYHCSCYDFNETKWDTTIYTMNELKQLAENKINDNYDEHNDFWKSILKY